MARRCLGASAARLLKALTCHYSRASVSARVHNTRAQTHPANPVVSETRIHFLAEKQSRQIGASRANSKQESVSSVSAHVTRVSANFGITALHARMKSVQFRLLNESSALWETSSVMLLQGGLISPKNSSAQSKM